MITNQIPPGSPFIWKLKHINVVNNPHLVLARGDCVGIVIVEQFRLHVRINLEEENDEYKFVPYFSSWDVDENGKVPEDDLEIGLGCNLGLGIEILHVRGTSFTPLVDDDVMVELGLLD